MLDYTNGGSIMRPCTAILIAQLHLVIERERLGSFYIRIGSSTYLLVYRQLLLRRFTCIFIVLCQALLLHSHVVVMSTYFLHSHNYTKDSYCIRIVGSFYICIILIFIYRKAITFASREIFCIRMGMHDANVNTLHFAMRM
jgi:hypothetical protein